MEPKLKWEKLGNADTHKWALGGQAEDIGPTEFLRSKIPGGWLLCSANGTIAFVPDPDHKWDGNSLP